MILASAEVVIWPKVLPLKVVNGDGVVAVPCGITALKLFVTLNASARNSSF